MKKISLVLFLCLFLVGCSSTDKSGFIKSDVQSVLSKISNKDTFLVMIESNDCYSCETYKEELKDIIDKQELSVFTLNFSEISAADIDQANIALGKHKSWPVMFYVVEGEIPTINKYEYSLAPEGWKTWLEDMKIISK